MLQSRYSQGRIRLNRDPVVLENSTNTTNTLSSYLTVGSLKRDEIELRPYKRFFSPRYNVPMVQVKKKPILIGFDTYMRLQSYAIIPEPLRSSCTAEDIMFVTASSHAVGRQTLCILMRQQNVGARTPCRLTTP